MDEIQPHIDVIVIQMDGDVVRKEKEVHCMCDTTACEEKGNIFPLYCGKAITDCPVEIPCRSHADDIESRIEHGTAVLNQALGSENGERVIITIPCDSTDAWIVAAYDDDIENPEMIADPWRNMIARRKDYHGIRVRGDKKNTRTYEMFLNHLTERWSDVTDKCISARQLDYEVRRLFTGGRENIVTVHTPARK